MKKCFIAVLLLLFVLTGVAMAQEWYIDDGNIEIFANNKGQYITQEGIAEGIADPKPVILQRDISKPADHRIITQCVQEGAIKFTIRDLNIRHIKSPITVTHKSTVTITVEGVNVLKNTDSMWSPVIDVSAGSLTINGNGSLQLITDSLGAKIGSFSGWADKRGKDMRGFIHITDNVTILTQQDKERTDGAAIGAGYNADMSGEILIDGNANIVAVSNNEGAAIGGGKGSAVTGTITIADHAIVTAESPAGAVAIGGEDGSASLTIRGNTKVSLGQGISLPGGQYSIQQGVFINDTIVETSDDLAAHLVSNAEGLTVVPRENQDDHICWYGDWMPNGDGTHSAVCKRKNCTTITACSLRTAVIDGEEISYCPICGDGLLQRSKATVKAVSGKLPEGDVSVFTGSGRITVGLEYAGKVAPVGCAIKLTVPNVKAKQLLLIGADGSQTPIEFTQKSSKVIFELDLTEADSAFILVK